MRSEDARENLWRCHRSAFLTLVWLGIIIVPTVCPFGHAWGPTDSSKKATMHCTYRYPSDANEED